jgi:hypothetical protein
MTQTAAIQPAVAQPAPKVSQMSSVRNGEIPVILVFVRDQMPQNYKMVTPKEAEEILSLIEFMQDYLRAASGAEAKKKAKKNGGLPNGQK